MQDYTYLLACRDANGISRVAECNSCQAEAGVLAEVDGELLEVVAVTFVALDSDDYRFVAELHEIKKATAIYRKAWVLIQEETDGNAAD